MRLSWRGLVPFVIYRQQHKTVGSRWQILQLNLQREGHHAIPFGYELIQWDRTCEEDLLVRSLLKDPVSRRHPWGRFRLQHGSIKFGVQHQVV